MSKLVELDDQNEGFKNMALEARKKVKENKSIEKQKSADKTVENVSLSTTGTGESESLKDSKPHDLVHDKERKLPMYTKKIIFTEKKKEKEKEKENVSLSTTGTGESESLKDSKPHDLVHDKEGKLPMLQTEKKIEPEKKMEKEKEKEKGKEEGKKKEKKKDKNGETGNMKEKKEKEKKKKKKKNVDTTSSSSSSESESDKDNDDKKTKSSIQWHEYLQLPTSKPWILLGALGMSLLVLVGGAVKMMKKPRDEGDHMTTKKRTNSSSTDDQMKLCPSCYNNHKNTLVKNS